MNSDTHRSDSRKADLQHAQLQRSLYETALRMRAGQDLANRARVLRGLGLACLPLLVLGFAFPQHAATCLYLIAALCIGGLVFAWFKYQGEALDYLAAARRIEADNPELKQALVTAVERQLQGDSTFLSERVTAQALAHTSLSRWDETGRSLLSAYRIEYLGTVSGVLLLLAASFFAAQREGAPGSGTTASVSAADTEVRVLPGDAEVERGSSLVVTARFQGSVPSQATLIALSDDGVETRFPMAQSLSDPVFAHTLQRVENGLRYRIEYAEAESESFRLQVYDLPRLGRADAHLDYPDYTGWPDRVIEDTQRLSAIEGTALDYFFNTNKPLRQAYLVDTDGQRIELAAVNDDRTRFQFSQVLSENARYTLLFTDDADRRNDYSPEIRIDVLPNNRPSLRLTNPRGDQRVSPIQELSLRGEASDDFGLLDYGVALVIGAEAPRLTSLMDPDAEDKALSATLSHLVALEEYQLQPKDALSWYLWAEDYGPDGERRRSTSDLFFADVRALDEIFREQDGGGGGQMGQGNAGQDLLEKQKRVSISLFRIKNTATRPESSVEDLDVVQRSQIEVIDELRQLVPQLQDPSARDNAADALRFMEGVDVSLNTAIDRPTLSTLDVAWSDSQGAYQALVKLTESEYNIARSQNQQGGGGGSSRNQAQLNELEFRQEENRYETASQAQALSSPEERQNLELMSKLNELSRRQEDMNTRLQEMQSALAEARSEEERERIRRELKRLEEEQRQLLADADEAIQQTGTRQSAREARQQLEQARENMQRASDQLEQEDVSQALASGTRAQDTLDETREQMRNRNSSQFSEAMRQARSRARELSEQQQKIESELERLGEQTRRSLDDSEVREGVAQSLDAQSQRVEDFLEELQDITAGAEAVEPGLYRQLYQVLRESNGARFEERYGTSAQLLRQGFLDDAQRDQSGLGEELEALSDRIAEAAESILGDEATTLQYAQSELESLREQLEQERPFDPSQRGRPSQERSGNQASNQAQNPGENAGQSNGQATPSPSGSQGDQPGEGQSSQQAQAPRPASGQPRSVGGGSGAGLGGATSLEEFIQNAIAELENAASGPLTGSGFSNWVDRLSTVESLIDDPLARARVSEAREQAENLRRDFKRHGALPQWEMVEDAIASPLDDVRGWLAEEINRIENPESLQPVDRDPVPQEYLEIVRRYYESLGDE